MADREDTGGGKTSTTGKRRKRRRGNPIPLAPSKPKDTSGSTPKGTSGPGKAGRPRKDSPAGKAGAGTKSSTTNNNSASSAENRAVNRENAAKRKASDRYIKQAGNLEAQAQALKLAINKSYGRNLRQQLADISDVLKDQQSVVREGFRDRFAQLEGASEDNEKAASGQTMNNTQNLVRERNMAVGEAMSLGAGESDVLRSQMMSLRNWQANQSEIQRGFFDTLRSVNSSLTDLNTDTKTALVNNQVQANADREQLWTNYFNRRSESLTQLGNIRGQQADYFAMADEMAVGGKDKKAKNKKPKSSVSNRTETATGGSAYFSMNAGPKTGGKTNRQPPGGAINLGGRVRNERDADRGSERAFMAASKEAGKSWDNPGVSKKLMKWDGRDEFTSSTNLSKLEAAPTVNLGKRPEGATLRKW